MTWTEVRLLVAMCVLLLPIVLMVVGTLAATVGSWASPLTSEPTASGLQPTASGPISAIDAVLSQLLEWLIFLGDPTIAMLVSVPSVDPLMFEKLQPPTLDSRRVRTQDPFDQCRTSDRRHGARPGLATGHFPTCLGAEDRTA